MQWLTILHKSPEDRRAKLYTKTSVPTSQRTLFACIIKTNQPMFWGGNLTKHMMKMCAQNAEFLNTRMYDTCSYHWSLKCENLQSVCLCRTGSSDIGKGNNIPSFIKFPLPSNTFINNRNIVWTRTFLSKLSFFFRTTFSATFLSHDFLLDWSFYAARRGLIPQ